MLGVDNVAPQVNKNFDIKQLWFAVIAAFVCRQKDISNAIKIT